MQKGRGPVLVISTPQGQLGNSLVHFAGIRAFAIKNNIPLLHLTFDPYAELFPLSNTDLFSSFAAGQDLAQNSLVCSLLSVFKSFLSVVTPGDPQSAALKRETLISTPPEVFLRACDPHVRHAALLFGCAFTRWVEAGQFKSLPVLILRAPDDTELDLSKDPRMQFIVSSGEETIVLLDGWLIRANQDLEERAGELRRYFTPQPETTAAVERVSVPLRARTDAVVGVHIRRKDYRDFMGGRYFWPVERYLAWMRELTRAVPDRKLSFLVCSDEPLQAEQFAEFDFSFGPGSAVADMYSFARCDVLFGPPSTFTGWAHFYGGNQLAFMRTDQDSVAEVVTLLGKCGKTSAQERSRG